VDFSARTLLRVGIALMGARITFDQVTHLGLSTVAKVAIGLILTILSGLLLAKLMRRTTEEGLLTGGAVAICGASAAMAISAVLPQSRENDRLTLFTVVGVTVFSTLAMVLYPLLLGLTSLSPVEKGIFLGGTIHDVAQVVAAGMIVGPTETETATLVKLFRVLLLVPVVVVISFLLQRAGRASIQGTARNKIPAVPLFLIGFVVLLVSASVGVWPPEVIALSNDASRGLLVIAIAAAGVKTSFEDILKLGWAPVVMLLVETAFIASFFLVALLFL
jgi:uncharacterized integral membrane protein (TIGR00698 family)